MQFFFRNSRMSNNGTDINVGQIPEFLYVSETSNAQSPNTDEKDKTTDVSVALHILLIWHMPIEFKLKTPF